MAMTPIQEQITSLRAALPAGVRLVAVSKYHPKEALREAYEAGQRIFGESHVQELQEKYPALPKDIEWHFIGHLQTNKVKYIAPYISLIHAVDSFRLLREIDKQAAKCNRVIPCLLQLHIAQEETKFGFTPDECRAMLSGGEWRNLSHIKIVGLMTMASNVDGDEQIRREFHLALTCFRQIRDEFFAGEPSFCECSWGMSDDYPLAIQEGSTMVRIGSKIFGTRNYYST